MERRADGLKGRHEGADAVAFSSAKFTSSALCRSCSSFNCANAAKAMSGQSSSSSTANRPCLRMTGSTSSNPQRSKRSAAGSWLRAINRYSSFGDESLLLIAARCRSVQFGHSFALGPDYLLRFSVPQHLRTGRCGEVLLASYCEDLNYGV